MGAWEVKGPAEGACKSWRDVYPELAEKVTKIKAPVGRAIGGKAQRSGLIAIDLRNVSECLAANIARWPDREAYVFYPGGQRMTWRDVGAQVDRAAARLRHDFGFKKGDRLCLLMAGLPRIRH